MESDPNFSKLSDQDRQLHLWATARTSDKNDPRAGLEMMAACIAQADILAGEHEHAVGDKPIVDVSTDSDRNSGYVKLQAQLLYLSSNSKELVAENSTHFVIIDRPDVVVDAIQQVVQSVRNNSKLYKNAPPQN
jgi:hypothetical protein